MKKIITLLAIPLILASCSSTPKPEPTPTIPSLMSRKEIYKKKSGVEYLDEVHDYEYNEDEKMSKDTKYTYKSKLDKITIYSEDVYTYERDETNTTTTTNTYFYTDEVKTNKITQVISTKDSHDKEILHKNSSSKDGGVTWTVTSYSIASHEYDDRGNVILYIFNNELADYNCKIQYSYDDLNRITSKISSEKKDGVYVYTDKYEYEYTTEEKYTQTKQSFYRYNTSLSEFQLDSYFIHKYDLDGLNTSYTAYNADGTIITRSNHLYDENVELTVVYSPSATCEGYHVTSIVTDVYDKSVKDEDAKLVEEITTSPDSSKATNAKTIKRYKYDKYENETEYTTIRYTKDSSGELIESIFEKQIYYYK